MNSSPKSFCLRGTVTAASVIGLVLIGAGPAGAHMEVSAEGAQAGTGPVTLTFWPSPSHPAQAS